MSNDFISTVLLDCGTALDGKPILYCLKKKPSGKSRNAVMGKMRVRFQKSQSSQTSHCGTIEKFAELVSQGVSFMPFVDGEGQQVFAVDVDDPDMLSPLDALERCWDEGVWPHLLYFTLSATLEKPKYRIVWVNDTVLDGAERDALATAFLDLFPEADAACVDRARFFLGSCGEVWRCWEVNADGEGPY